MDSWKQFQESGLLWWINRILHTFGWAIVLTVQEDGTVTNAEPSRVRYRGFDRQDEEEGFRRVAAFMEVNAKRLKEDAHLPDITCLSDVHFRRFSSPWWMPMWLHNLLAGDIDRRYGKPK